jgi:glycosyltransferase involved in cell wall biosynthesis
LLTREGTSRICGRCGGEMEKGRRPPEDALMRICFLATSYPRWRGDLSGSFIEALADKLTANHGCEITVIAPYAPGSQLSERRGRIEVRRFRYAWPDRIGRLCYDGGIPAALQLRPWMVWQVPGLLASMFKQAVACASHADLIHCHWTICGFVGLQARSVHRRPVVVTAHGSDVSLAPSLSLLQMLNRQVVRRADAMVVVGSRQLSALAVAGCRSRVAHIPNGVDDVFLPDPLPSCKDVDLVFVGRMAPEKRPDLLIEALSELGRRGVRPRTRLVGDGPLCSVLARKIGEAGLSHVELVGPVAREDVAAELDRAAALVLVSSREGFPTVVLQAMARGLAVLCTDVGSICDVVRDGTNGELLPAKITAAMLAERLERFLCDRQRIAAMGAAARTTVRTDYTWDLAARKYYDLYRDLLSADQAGGVP